MPAAHTKRASGANDAATVLVVPGLRGDVPNHWQTLLARRLPAAVTVGPMGRDQLSCSARVAALDDAIAGISGPVILVAHSAGVVVVAHWARQHQREIKGALLATPPDMERPMPIGAPTREALAANGWLPTPREPLPFPSVFCASRNDPLSQFTWSAQLASAWGSRLVDLGEVGHLNPASGYGDWPMADELIAEFI